MADDTGAPADIPPALPGALPGTIQNLLGRARVVITPYPFGVSDADNLRIVSVNSQPGITIEIHGRQAVAGFESKPFRYVHTPNSNRTAKTDDFVLGAGLVTNLSVFVAGGSPLIGQTFVIIQLVRSMGVTAYVMGTLLSGYVTSTQGLGWPGSAIESSIEGGGYPRTIQGTAPAAGAEINEVVPAGCRWKLLSMVVSFSTDGTAGNRFPLLHLTSGAFGGALCLAGSTQAPSQNGVFTWAPYLPFGVNPAFPAIQAPIPGDLVLLAGGSIVSLTSGLSGGDRFAAPLYVVQEWLEAT